MKEPKRANLVVVDIETTGTNPFKHDALAIAFVPINDGRAQKQVFVFHEALVWSKFARENFQRYRDAWNGEAIPPLAACAAIESYIAETFSNEEVTLIGHNVGFDVAFLRKLAYQGGREQLEGISHRASRSWSLVAHEACGVATA